MLHPTAEAQTDDATADGNGTGTPGLTKLRYSSFLIASLAYFMAKQRDAVGFAYFDDTLHQYLPARSSTSHLHSILLTLETLQTAKSTRMGAPLHQIAERAYQNADWYSSSQISTTKIMRRLLPD